MNKVLGWLCYWCVWPIAFIVQRKSHRVRVALIYTDYVLCIRSRCRTSHWQLPGGGIKRTESIRQAAIREVFEEVGITIRDNQLIGCPVTNITDKGLKYTMHPFIVKLSSKPQLTNLPFETYQVKWISLQTILHGRMRVMPSVEQVIRCYDDADMAKK